MLDDYAIAYLSLPESQLRGYPILLFIAAAVASGIVASITKSKAELDRAPYYAFSGAVFFGISVCQIVWLWTIPAMASGYLWLVMAISLVSTAVGGYYSGVIAMARSRSAFGHGKLAVLGFLPLLNFWLLLKQPRPKNFNTVPVSPLCEGGMGVALGTVLFIISFGIGGVIDVWSKNMQQSASTDAEVRRAGMDYFLRSNKGIEGTLQAIAAEAQSTLPATVDDLTTLERIEAIGPELRRTYKVKSDNLRMTDTIRESIISSICSHDILKRLMDEGATIREVYTTNDGAPAANATVTSENCKNN